MIDEDDARYPSIPLNNADGEKISSSTAIHLKSVRERGYGDISSPEEIQNLLSERDKQFANIPLALDEDKATSKVAQLNLDVGNGNGEAIIQQKLSSQNENIDLNLRDEKEYGDIDIVAKRQTENIENCTEANQNFNAVSDSAEYNNDTKEINPAKTDVFGDVQNSLDTQANNVTSEQGDYDVDDLAALDALLGSS